MIDFKELLELGVFGLCGLFVFIFYKIVAYKFPKVNGGGHSKRAADALESIERSMQSMLIKQDEANTILQEISVEAKLEVKIREKEQDEKISQIYERLKNA